MDFIDERNLKEQMARSIVKRRNVVYAAPELIGPKGEEEAKQILEQIAQNLQEGEERKRREIEKMVEQQEQNQAEITRILNEKQEQLERNIEAGMEDRAEEEEIEE